MGSCTFVLLLMVANRYGTWTSTPMSELTTSWDLNDSPIGPNLESSQMQSEEKKAVKISTKGPSCPKNGDTKQSGKIRKRIIGGLKYDPKLHDAKEPDWEHWTASIEIFTKPLDNGLFETNQCGGALITEKHVLTALHCLTDLKNPDILDPKYFKVYFDVDNAKLHKGTKFRAKKFFYVNMHDGTGKVKYYNNTKKSTKDDIAVIELEREIDDTDCLSPIKITNKPLVRRFQTVGQRDLYWMAGWGATGFTNGRKSMPEDLHYINRQPNIPCPRKFNDVDKKICFQRTHQYGTCAADSGSPGVIKLKDEWYLQGIHRGGRRAVGYKTSSCNEAKSIGVDTNVFEYKADIEEWIRPYILQI